MNFRNASIEDIPFILEVYNSSIPGRMSTADTEEVTESFMLEWYKKHSFKRPLLIAEVDDITIGYISFKDFYGRPAYNGAAEISVYIHPQHQKKGYGRKMIEYCISNAPHLGIHTLLGFAFSHNIPSLKILLEYGFEEYGHLNEIAIMDNKKFSLKIMGKKLAE